MEETNDIKNICQLLLDRYKQAINETGHIASGELANTATYLTKFDGKYFEVIFNLEEYWKYLENGRKPGGKMPPVDKIYDWIQVRHIIPSRSLNGKLPTTRQLAFAMSKSIADKGIQPTKLLQKTIDNSNDLIDLLIDAIFDLLQNEINEDIKDI